MVKYDTVQNKIQGLLQFTIPCSEKPVTQVSATGGGRDDPKTGLYETREIVIHDGRDIAETFDMDLQGFAFLKHETKVKDFTDEEQIQSIYYSEIEEILLNLTKAKKVLVFDYTIRIGDPAKRQRLGVRDPVRSAHNDFTDISAPQRVRDLLPPEEADAMLKRRFTSVNVWRPILGPVKTDPLAICSWDSLRDGDMIPAERVYDNRIGGILNLSYNSSQRWTYFSNMVPDEIILLKCFDSMRDGRARWTAHAAIEQPGGNDRSLPARESIEIRTLIFY